MAESTESTSQSPQSPVVRTWTRLVGLADKMRDAPLFLLRFNIGFIFVGTGKGKVTNVEKVTHFFEKLHIPMPHFNAVLVGWTELIGGTLLVLGLATRFSAAALAVTMVVALATAIIPGIGPDLQESGDTSASAWFFSFNGKDEFTYLLLLIAIVVLGPGKLALDRLIEKRVLKKS
jgi:putative oxidoreductase